MRILKLFMLVSFVHFSTDMLSQNTDSLKCWSNKDKLKWSDFKGKIPDDGLSAATWYRLTPIRIIKDDLINYDIKLVFKKYESWTADTTSMYLLSHEQLHFDIAELYARKLRKTLRDVVNQNPAQQDFSMEIQKLYLENANMQKQYDSETIHGVIRESQIKWEKKVWLELILLEDYASTPTDCQ